MSITLYDYSKIDDKYKEVCVEIQQKIKSLDVIDLSNTNNTDKKPVLFGYYGSDYYTKKYVGMISYKGQDINILSRFDRGNKNNYFLTYVLSKALNINIKAFPDLTMNAEMGMNWDIILAILFLKQLKSALSRGLYRKYCTFHYNNSSPKGAINIAQHIKLNPIFNGKCAYSAREYTLDNEVNHLILLAKDCLIKKNNALRKLVDDYLVKNNDTRIMLQQMEYSMDIFKMPSSQVILSKTERPIVHTVYHEYEPLRKTARMIVKRMGLDNIFQESSNEVSGMVFAMDKMWELFLENAVLYKKENWCLQTQNKTKILDEEYTIRPDFIITTNNKKIILDAKYKPKWGFVYNKFDKSGKWGDVKDDLYQVISYMHILKTKKGGVIFPLCQEQDDEEHSQYKKYNLQKNHLPDSFFVIPIFVPQSQKSSSLTEYADKFDKNCEIVRKEIDYICAEIALGGCIYPYLIDNNHKHEHSISEIYLIAYNYAERFSISEQDKIYYSEQELNFINQLIKKGKYDILNYNNK